MPGVLKVSASSITSFGDLWYITIQSVVLYCECRGFLSLCPQQYLRAKRPRLDNDVLYVRQTLDFGLEIVSQRQPHSSVLLAIGIPSL